ncbi:MAG TPA: SRPBCC domain-containing protein [Burkholderiaceae bacterium]|nr:SRPBCC domain-containing protein [Burkholderiaceae bacterium]
MYELTLNKRCNAPVARVFAAWSTAEMLKRWFGPGTVGVAEAQVDFRVGGVYRIVMRHDDGRTHIVNGAYRQIVANERLCFSWQWEGSEAVTEVELTFRAAGQQTDLTLLHREFPTVESRDQHNEGWQGCLVKLAVFE